MRWRGFRSPTWPCTRTPPPPQHAEEREIETWTSKAVKANLEVDSLETLSLALLEEEKEEENGSSQKFEGAKTCPGGFLL